MNRHQESALKPNNGCHPFECAAIAELAYWRSLCQAPGTSVPCSLFRGMCTVHPPPPRLTVNATDLFYLNSLLPRGSTRHIMDDGCKQKVPVVLTGELSSHAVGATAYGHEEFVPLVPTTLVTQRNLAVVSPVQKSFIHYPLTF